MRAALLLWLFVVLLLASPFRSPQADELFPEPPLLRSAVTFWKRIYTEVDTDGGLLHDARHLGVVYESIGFDSESRRARRRLINKRKAHWRAVLQRLAGGASPSDARERAVVESLASELGHTPTARDYRHAMRRLRFQLGQRNRFRAGLIRSSAYEARMHAVFAGLGLPEDLAHLPHVESSFHPRAYSKYGAAGIWQFIRSTGRRYLKIDYVVDERLDPMRATRAAAELLRRNYERLGTWPLAITAYNHGAAGMERAKRVLGTDDIGVIVEKYQSRIFGFASRNFYAQFLAAREIVHDYRRYFGDLERDTPEAVERVTLPFYADINDLERYLRVDRKVVAHYNPALRPPVFRGFKRLPAGYVLRLPKGTVGPDARSWLAAIPEDRRYDEQAASRFHTVRRGETLSRIAQIHNTSVSTIATLNNLRSAHRIYPGQVLELLAPEQEHGTSSATTVASAARAATSTAGTPEPGSTYSVRRGDTLSDIARRHGTTVSRLVALNNLGSRHRIFPGQSLQVGPPPEAKPVRVAAATPEPPEAAASAGERGSGVTDGTEVDGEERPADTMASAEGEELLAAYEIRDGDTLEDIAERHDTTVPEIVARNALDRWIYPGQQLRLPAGAGTVDPLAAAPAAETAPVATLPEGDTAQYTLAVPARASDSRWRRIDGKWIVVDAEETLGHYADWLQIPTQRLRNLNGLPFGRPVRMGRRLRLDFSRVSPETFHERRLAYHKAIEEDFLGSYRITGVTDHTLRRGENLWELSFQVYEVPPWLLYRFNPDTDLTHLRPGTRLTIPVIEPQATS
ncbi:MAG: LysM peptidoglycan-binding domain-containing protein [Gammaproteobacteria bacterium]|nr:LysM peptidoglycan-binding domain-containing protein [Gammaproteobacteria bacterium]